jgi:tRNA A37 threonylcarbamoyladenosine dehydratase
MDNDYRDRFGGLGRLLGDAACVRLHGAHVAVVGLGGVGSWTVEALARSGLGRLTLIDLDDVCVTNTNRQLPALSDTVGRPKVEVLAERIQKINPACRVEAVGEFFSEASASRLLLPGYDCVVDAIDAMTNKARLIAEARSRGYPVVTVGGAGGRRDATRIQSGDLGDAFGDELLRLVRKKLRRDHGYEPGPDTGRVRLGVRCVWSPERPVYPKPDGTCSLEPVPGAGGRMDCSAGFGAGVWVTGAFGLIAAQEALQLVLGAPFHAERGKA